MLLTIIKKNSPRCNQTNLPCDDDDDGRQRDLPVWLCGRNWPTSKNETRTDNYKNEQSADCIKSTVCLYRTAAAGRRNPVESLRVSMLCLWVVVLQSNYDSECDFYTSNVTLRGAERIKIHRRWAGILFDRFYLCECEFNWQISSKENKCLKVI